MVERYIGERGCSGKAQVPLSAGGGCQTEDLRLADFESSRGKSASRLLCQTF